MLSWLAPDPQPQRRVPEVRPKPLREPSGKAETPLLLAPGIAWSRLLLLRRSGQLSPVLKLAEPSPKAPKADAPASRCVSARSFVQSEDVLKAERAAVLAESLPVMYPILALLRNREHHKCAAAE